MTACTIALVLRRSAAKTEAPNDVVTGLGLGAPLASDNTSIAFMIRVDAPVGCQTTPSVALASTELAVGGVVPCT
jgi:hypothetical protein